MTRVLGVLAALVLWALVPSTAAGAPVPERFFGVMADGPALDGTVSFAAEAALMRRAGVGSVRVAFYWRDLQPEEGRPPDWGPTDRLVRIVARQRIEVLPVLVRAPVWATGGDDREGAVAPPEELPAFADAFAAFAAEAVRRYGPRGSFWAENPDLPRVPIRRWQVWNEPDIDRYWLGEPWAATYVVLLRAAHRAIKAADPGATVIAAGLTNRSWEDLAELYAAGARGAFDAAAIHPFSARVPNVLRIVRLARAEMRRRGDARKPLMLTEVSWSSGLGRSTFNYGWETTERGQAARIRDAFPRLAAERRRLRIGGVWWYTWLSPAIGHTDSFQYSGLRRLRGGRAVSKPALRAYRDTVRRLRAARSAR
jgi:hypothetical protein